MPLFIASLWSMGHTTLHQEKSTILGTGDTAQERGQG